MKAKQEVTRTNEIDQRFLLTGMNPSFCDPRQRIAASAPVRVAQTSQRVSLAVCPE